MEGIEKMPENTLVNKRVKRRVIGRVHRFIAVVHPALVPLCKAELESLLGPDHHLQGLPGGIEFSGRLTDAYRVNLLSRFANRILMHLAAFKATSFRQLEQKLAAFPWELYLFGGSPLKVRVSTANCRLYHTSAVAERVLKQVDRQLAQFGLPPAADQPLDQVQQLFVRGNRDRFSISIDSSGGHLYKRGIKTHGGRAPLRENLAAAVLKLAGYDCREPLLDPMCGSGTFSLEAALTAANIPPGWFRNFAFMQWPSFLDRRWRYLRNRLEGGIRHPADPSIFASDIDSRACRRLQDCIDSHGLATFVQVAEQDFFSLQPDRWTRRKGLIVINPPYGRRIEASASGAASMATIVDRLCAVFNGWRLALIAPRRQLAEVSALRLRIVGLSHGGLPVAAGVGSIP